MVTVDGLSLHLSDVIKVAIHGEPVMLEGTAASRIAESREWLERYLDCSQPAYGVNTGFGALCNVKVAPDALRQLQQNLVRSHASGVGPFFPREVVRGAMLLRANSLSRGQSGVRLELVQTLIDMLNRGVIPAVHQKGSLGASGDLAPLADLALVMTGEGLAYFGDQLLPGHEAMSRAGIHPVSLEAKEGLALLNGTAFMTSLAALACHRASQLIEALNTAAALSLVAFGGHVSAYSQELVLTRPHPGAVAAADHLRRLLDPPALSIPVPNGRMQDPYSFRCVPQVHGPFIEALEHAIQVVEVEINSTTDNPILIDRAIISGGNFHGQPIGAVMDYLTIVVTSAAAMSERRVNQLLHPGQSGLPAFLALDPGLNCGLMIAQYTAASLVNENRVLASPASVQSVPVSADQEDHISMATYASRKAMQAIDNALAVAAIELLCAAQAIDVRRHLGMDTAPLPHGDPPVPAVENIYRAVRRRVPFAERDTSLTPYIEDLVAFIKNSELHAELERCSACLRR